MTLGRSRGSNLSDPTPTSLVAEQKPWIWARRPDHLPPLPRERLPLGTVLQLGRRVTRRWHSPLPRSIRPSDHPCHARWAAQNGTSSLSLKFGSEPIPPPSPPPFALPLLAPPPVPGRKL